MVVAAGNRRMMVVLLAVIVIGLTAGAGYRVLAPAEVVTPAYAPYPSAVSRKPKTLSRISSAPLVIEGRLRVYATERQVWADQPVAARNRRSAYWSYRRWPAEVIGVVAVDTRIITQWSDGKLVALDGRSGRVLWRAIGPASANGYAGRSSGASTVYTPPALRTAVGPDRRMLVVVVGERELAGYELTSGSELWRTAIDEGCHTDPVTTTAGELITINNCAQPPSAEFRDANTGIVTRRWRPDRPGRSLTVEPIGCTTGRSQCHGIRTGGDTGWLVERGAPIAAPALDTAGSVLVDGIAATCDGAVLVARSALTAAQLWRLDVPAGTRLIAAQPGRLHLLTPNRELLTVAPATGAQMSRFPLKVGRDSNRWVPGLVYASDGFVAAERLREPVDPAADDERYYYLAFEPVILAVT